MTSVYEEIQRFEKVPNRREPVTPEMHARARLLAARVTDDMSLEAAMADWWTAALLAGLRLSEWAQPNDMHANTGRPHLNIFGDPAAFCIDDIEIEMVDRRRMKGSMCLMVRPNDVHKLWITFRTQKNGQHGEKRLFVRNPVPGGYCMVVAMYRILSRFTRLCGAWTTNMPLAVYRPEHQKGSRMITAKCIERHMRSIAAVVHSLHPVRNKMALQRWSSHSLRVGACTMLHTQGFSVTQIRWLLRWRSDAFMVYLRNAVPLACQQNQALDRAAAMPQFM